MNTTLSRRAVLTAAAALAATTAAAQPAGFALSSPATRTGSSTVRGKTIAWRVEAGETLLRNAAGAPRATIFSTAYMAQGADPATRPVTFLFNGGPLAPARGLHEALAPRITGAAAGAPGFTLTDNPDSLIDATDLVFVDPPGTGYARFVTPDAKGEYWGIEQDGAGVAQFIAAWLEAHGRLGSPKFMIGQSYAGARIGQAARLLAERPRGAIAFRGIVAVSPVLASGSQNPMAGQADRPWLTLPSQAAVARFHGKGAHLSKSVEQVAEDARRFALGPYAAALAPSAVLSAAEKASMAAQVAGFIGLPPAMVEAENLFVSVPKFLDALLADRRESLDMSDGSQRRPIGPDGKPQAPPPEYDVTRSIDAFYRDAIGYASPVAYVRVSDEANRTWNNNTTRWPDSTPTIFKALAVADPRLHIQLSAGYFDLNVPFNLPLSRYLAAELPAARFGYHLYPTGHGVYNDKASRPRSTDDLRAFYRRALT